ncbi:hypothetical protein Pan97_15680 [Bremerella volcania]|uniref:General stress protein 17M-like domain-containing protein n=1 Tax=Bremerella volcania TaxID=2527984 RepID=A0A518C5R3_9BACT|nr:general stress protein [Bremerella volcania]QDU74559.1 hypothetical protein Pan97_15680 [Bremerella volcania]
MRDRSVCIAIVEDHRQVQSVLDSLLDAGFDASHISVIGKDHPEDRHVHGYLTTGEQMGFWGGQGAVWGGIMGALAGAGFLFVPGIGPLMLGGPLLSMIVGGLEGSVGLAGIEAVFAGLLHLAFSKEHLATYEKELKAGKSLVLVHGNSGEVIRAKDVLTDAGIGVIAVHAQ